MGCVSMVPTSFVFSCYILTLITEARDQLTIWVSVSTESSPEKQEKMIHMIRVREKRAATVTIVQSGQTDKAWQSDNKLPEFCPQLQRSTYNT